MRYAPAILFTAGVGSAAGLAFWVCAGQPTGLLECAIASGIGTTAVFMAGALWRIRAAVRAGDEYPEDRPSLELPPGTRQEWRADLNAMAESRMTVDDFVDRWSGRLRVDDVHDVERMKKAIADAVMKELQRPVDPAAPELFPCKHCLGLHTAWEKCSVMESKLPGGISEYLTEEPVSGESPFAEADAAIAKSKFQTGQWVRVKPGGMHHHMLVKLTSVQYLARILIWSFISDEGQESLAEACFEFAYPMKDEVWEEVECAKHSPASKGYPPRVFVVDQDWKGRCLAHPFLRCGCIRPVNFGHGVTELPRTGIEYVAGTPPAPFIIGDKIRVREGVLADRIFTLKKLENDVERVWLAEFGGAHEYIREDRFVLAFPKEGEVWHYKTPCPTCDAKFGPVVKQSPFNVNVNWEHSWITREHVRCGCLYRIGTQG